MMKRKGKIKIIALIGIQSMRKKKIRERIMK